ncbi:MAG: hypothetical protein WCF23_22115 [Candidatus Nitrosopolaris sp.]
MPLFTQGCATAGGTGSWTRGGTGTIGVVGGGGTGKLDWAWTMGAIFIITKANIPATIIEIVPSVGWWFMTSFLKSYYLSNSSQAVLRK